MNPIEFLHETMRLQFSERILLNKILASASWQTLSTYLPMLRRVGVMPALQKGLLDDR